VIPLIPLSLVLRLLPYLAVCAALGGAYWLGTAHSTAKCDKARTEATVEAQAAAIEQSLAADSAATQREQSKIIQQAALAGARKAINEAKSDACIDTAVPADVLNALSLRPQEPAAKP